MRRKKVEAFLGGAVAVRAGGAGGGRRALLGGYLLGGLLVHVGQAALNEVDGQVEQLLEVVGRVIDFLPLEAEPADVFHDGIDVFHVFLHGIGVIEAEVARAAVPLGDAEVDADGLGVADVQVAVGLGRETGLHAACVAAFLQVLFYDCFDEVQAFCGRFFHCRSDLWYAKTQRRKGAFLFPPIRGLRAFASLRTENVIRSIL